jgi:hypothetical protein
MMCYILRDPLEEEDDGDGRPTAARDIHITSMTAGT